MTAVANFEKTQTESWFDSIVATLRAHQVQLETDTASDEITSIYNTLMHGDTDTLLFQNKLGIQRHFVSQILLEYIKQLSKQLPEKLAFDFNDASVLVPQKG